MADGDLNLGNLLLNVNCTLKVCDFGLVPLVQMTTAEEAGVMTEYVVTRWYRAPEIMLSVKYTRAIDIWAVGCILAELLSGWPLFPGRNYKHQLEFILHIIGTPTPDKLRKLTSRRSRDYIRGLPTGICKRRAFRSLFLQASAEAISLLMKTLTFNPEKRMRVDEALKHPYLAAYVSIN
ncbi:kinase-like domain-containing protein [Mycena leptocephala]|nr:kinase-like domain-containing protein [Mycena leptocephala]